MKKKGQTLSEFAIVTALLITICASVLFLFQDKIKDVLDNNRIKSLFDSSTRTDFTSGNANSDN